VLGTAQDAGLPQIGCDGDACVAARRDPARRRLVTSLLLCDPRSGARWLFDATPDLREQVERAKGHPATRDLPGPRPPLFDGVFLTHAHMGHYGGLLFLGPEAYGARDLPVHCTERMATFLAGNGPWSLLVATGCLVPTVLRPGEPLALAEDLTVTALTVPHREELTDTVAFRIEGPARSVLYLPDIDKWERWETPVERVIAGVDVALLDGAFFDGDEVPGRDLSEIPHPLVSRSLERFTALPLAERRKVRFTHLNHTNPAADPGSRAAARVRALGMAVAAEGERFDLDR
jgi:pyrroloquinoline quinone biosynthesis protein B